MESILVFGAGELQCSLINTIKKMGFRSIVIDPDPDAEGRIIADVFIPLSVDDYDGTRRIAIEYGVVALVTAATDNPLPMMAKLAEDLGLRFPSYNSVMSVLDKGSFKNLLIENNIPCAKGRTYSVDQKPEFESLNFPAIIKPNKNSGSRGVVRCNSTAELATEIVSVCQYCPDGKYLVEEYIKGDEISVEGLVINGKLQIIQITDKILGPPPYNVEMGHIQPSKYWSCKEEIQALLQHVVDVSGLNYCAVHPELKVNENGIFIIEIGPRLGGDYITSDLVPLSTGIDMEEALISISMGLNPQINRLEGASMISYIDIPQGKMIKSSVSENQVKQLCFGVQEFKLNLKAGEVAKHITNSLNRHGYWIMSNDSKSELITLMGQYTNVIHKLILGNEV